MVDKKDTFYTGMTSALFLAVPTTSSEKGTTFYTILLNKAYDRNAEKYLLKKRFTNFRDLDKDLREAGLQDLPSLPSIFMI